MTTTEIALMLLVVLVFDAAFFVFGYDKGVKDTEERWSDAVGRADGHRKLEGR